MQSLLNADTQLKLWNISEALKKPSILQLIPSPNAEVVERMPPPVILGIKKPK